MILKRIKNYISVNKIADFLIMVMILVQDIDVLVIFKTPFYKYLVLLLLAVLLYDVFKNKRKIIINIFYVLILVVLYLFLYIFWFNKSIIVPSVFLAVEFMTFILYIQSKDTNAELVDSLLKIIYYSSIILAIFGLIQFVSYKLNISFIYKNITQHMIYLHEGRISSIYTEPAHLCAILCSGIFVSMYKLMKEKSKIHYLFFVLLLTSCLLCGSIIVYVSLLVFIVFFYYVYIKKLNNKKRLIIVTALLILNSLIVFTFIDDRVITMSINKIHSLLSKREFGEDTSNNNDSNNNNEKVNNDDVISEDEYFINDFTKEELLNSQLYNGTSFAIKSNFKIGISKMKDGYYFGTGFFTHELYYDKYMTQLYPSGYIRFNYTDASSLFIRIFSEFGVVGFVVYIITLLYLFIHGLKSENKFLLFILLIFITNSMRLGEYNWILNCLPFVILLNNISILDRFNYVIDMKKVLKNE